MTENLNHTLYEIKTKGQPLQLTLTAHYRTARYKYITRILLLSLLEMINNSMTATRIYNNYLVNHAKLMLLKV